MLRRTFWLIPIVFSLGCIDVTPPWDKAQDVPDAYCPPGAFQCARVEPRGGNGGGGTSRSALDAGSANLPETTVESRDAAAIDSPPADPDVPGAAGRTGTGGVSGTGGMGGSVGASSPGSAGTGGIVATGGRGGSGGRSTGKASSSGRADAGVGGNPGKGGTIGSGGSAGGADPDGGIRSGCQGHADCAAGQVCNSEKCEAPQGLVVLRVPLTTHGQDQRYWYPFNPEADLTKKTVTLRLYAPGVSSGLLSIYLTTPDFVAGSTVVVPFSGISDGWKDIVINGGEESGSFDPAHIKQVTIEVESTGSGPWKNPTVIYIDKVVISKLTVGDTFDSSKGGVLQSSTQAVPGSTLTWSSSLP